MGLQRIMRSTVIDAPIERVWAVLRDFNSHAQWHPAIADSRIEDGRRPDEVGCVRAFRLKDGGALREQLILLSDRDHRLSYSILDSTVPLQRYVAHVELKPVTDGRRTFFRWHSTFGTPRGQERELAALVAQGVYEAGFAGLKQHLGQPVASSSRAALPSGTVLPAQVIVLNGRGGPEQLKLVDRPAAPPGHGEVRLRQTAIGLNFIDVYVRNGQYAGLLEPGGVPGFEAAATVLDIGPGVSHLLPGDRVAYACPPAGAYASVRTMSAEQLIALPPHVSDEQAAALALKGMTAEYCLHRLHRIERDEPILVHAAAGALGMLVAQWAKALGAFVIGTVGSEDKARRARAYCDRVIVASDGRFAEAVLQITRHGVRLIVDGLGERAREENFAALAPTGHWISVGQAGGKWAPVEAEWLTRKSVTLSRPVIFHYTADAARREAMARRVFDALRDGILQPAVTRYALGAAAQAHADLEARRTTGQVVLVA